MTELAQKTVDKQQTPPLHYYHEVKWRLLAEVPWLVITLALTVIMFLGIILLSRGQFTSERLFGKIVSNIMIMGFLVIPMIIIVASGDADLSLGFLAGVVGWIVAILSPEMGLGPAIFMSLLVALGVGLINGLLVGLAKLKGIVVTFAMSFFLTGLMLSLSKGRIGLAPEGLVPALARSPLILLLWILLVIACAALMVFKPFGRRPRAGEPEQEPPGLRLLYRGLPFVFSSFMAWISGILLLSWVGYTTSAAGSDYAEIALLATLMGGTAYYAGTGFVLSGAIALIAIVLFQIAIRMLNLSPAQERVILGALLLIMLPVAHYYHAGFDWLYHQQSENAKDASIGDNPQPQ